MNTDHELGRTLRERADGITGTPLTFDDVRGRARRIRRRRAAGVAGGLALVAAVALPIALLGGTGADRSEPDPAPSPTRAVDPYADGGVPTLQDGVIIYPDGPRIPVQTPAADIRQFTPLGTDRWVLSTWTDGRGAVVVIDEAGQAVGQYRSGGNGALAVSADHDAVAWVGPDGSPMLLLAGSDEPQALAHLTVSGPEVVAITGDCSTTCEVVGHYDDSAGGLGSSWAASTDGTVRDLPAGVPAVVDASSDGALLAGLDEYDADGTHTCGGVYDVAAGDYAWRSCEESIYDFSPSGALVATTFTEGLGPTRIDVRDATTGELLVNFTGGTITSWAWEDDAHLLAVVVMESGETSVIRLSAGNVETDYLEGFHTDDPTLSVPVQLPLG